VLNALDDMSKLGLRHPVVAKELKVGELIVCPVHPLTISARPDALPFCRWLVKDSGSTALK
jgi:hypothetical protein